MKARARIATFFFIYFNFFFTIKSLADDLINENKETFKSQLLRTHGGTLKRPSVQPEVLKHKDFQVTLKLKNANKHLIREAILS